MKPSVKNYFGEMTNVTKEISRKNRTFTLPKKEKI